MPKKPKLLFGDALKAEMDKLTRDWVAQEEQELKDMGAWPVVNDTFARIKSDMATKPSDDRIKDLAKSLTRSTITMVIASLKEYRPCDFDSIEREDQLDDWNMCMEVAQAYIRRLEAIL